MGEAKSTLQVIDTNSGATNVGKSNLAIPNVHEHRSNLSNTASPGFPLSHEELTNKFNKFLKQQFPKEFA